MRKVGAGHAETIAITAFDVNEGNCAGERIRPTLKRDIWFPPADPKNPTVIAQKARDDAWGMFCRTCPVLQECFEHAIANEVYGTWAGTTEHDRTRLRKEYESNRDPELLEYARNRLHAGYVPIPSITCVRSGCPEPVSRKGLMCRRHRAMLTRSENALRRRKS